MIKNLLLGILLISGFALAQEQSTEVKQDTLKNWSIQGQNTIMLNQAAF